MTLDGEDRAVLRIRDPRYRPCPEHSAGNFVFVTFGTEAAALPFFTDLVNTTIEGVARVGRHSLVAVGRNGDPSVFRTPPGCTITRWVDQAQVLREAAAIVCPGGSGSVLSALTTGVPMVIVPLVADQPTNAVRVEAVQAGRSVARGPEFLHRLTETLADVLEHRPGGLDSICREIAALPGPEAAVELLTVLANR